MIFCDMMEIDAKIPQPNINQDPGILLKRERKDFRSQRLPRTPKQEAENSHLHIRHKTVIALQVT